MPVYDYHCKKCSQDFTLWGSISQLEKMKKECPHCGSIDVEKIISRCDFQLKGQGWAKDGYQKKEGKNG